MKRGLFTTFMNLFRKRNGSKKEFEFEELGYRTMMETGNLEATRSICACHIQALEDDLLPEKQRIKSEIERYRQHVKSLISFLYGGLVAVSDAAMLTMRRKQIAYLIAATFLGAVAVVSNAATIYLRGTPVVVSLILGVAFAGVAGFVGHLVFEKVLFRLRFVTEILILLCVMLLGWASLEAGRARSLMLQAAAASADLTSSTSFVNDPAADANPEASTQSSNIEQRANQHLGRAALIAMFGTDIGFALLLAFFFELRHHEQYAAWCELKGCLDFLREFEERLSQLESIVERAKKACTAGILRAQHTRPKKHPPYLGAAVLFFTILAGVSCANAQDIKREEFILLDVSGSIGQSGNTDLFRQFESGIVRLLSTEPPQSRVWVSVIAADSFGGVHEVLTGWTPPQHGIFSEDLNRARKQLSTAFESKSLGFTPSAAGTDIFGAFAHAKVLMESATRNRNLEKEIWIFSDMVNESPGFSMPGVLPSGSQSMIELARAKKLLLALPGYRIHVVGATTTGLTLSEWSTIREFWIESLRASGAASIEYSAEAAVQR